MDKKDSDKVYQKGDRVCCIGDGLHIECIVVEDSIGQSLKGNKLGDIKVFDPITERELWVSRNQIDHDKQYYRDKALKELGI